MTQSRFLAQFDRGQLGIEPQVHHFPRKLRSARPNCAQLPPLTIARHPASSTQSVLDLSFRRELEILLQDPPRANSNDCASWTHRRLLIATAQLTCIRQLPQEEDAICISTYFRDRIEPF